MGGSKNSKTLGVTAGGGNELMGYKRLAEDNNTAYDKNIAKFDKDIASIYKQTDDDYMKLSYPDLLQYRAEANKIKDSINNSNINASLKEDMLSDINMISNSINRVLKARKQDEEEYFGTYEK